MGQGYGPAAGLKTTHQLSPWPVCPFPHRTVPATAHATPPGRAPHVQSV